MNEMNSSSNSEKNENKENEKEEEKDLSLNQEEKSDLLNKSELLLKEKKENALKDFFINEIEKNNLSLEKIDFNIDLSNKTIQLLINKKTIKEINEDPELRLSKKIRLKTIKKKLDHRLQALENELLKDKKKRTEVEAILIRLKKQILYQIFDYYSISDILIYNNFKGTSFSKKIQKSKESFVFILEIPDSIFGWDKIRNFMEEVNNERTKKEFDTIYEFLNQNTNEYDSEELNRIIGNSKSIIEKSSFSGNNSNSNNEDITHNGNNSNESNKNNSDSKHSIDFFSLKQDINHQIKNKQYEKLIKAYESLENKHHKALNLISYYVVINSLSVSKRIFNTDFDNSVLEYEDNDCLEEECNPTYFENILSDIFEDLKESNYHLHLAISKFISYLSQQQLQKFEYVKKQNLESKEKIALLKELMLSSFKNFLIAFGMICCFTYEINTEYYIIDSQIHLELSCDYDSFLNIAIQKKYLLELEMSRKGKEIIRNFTECKVKENYNNRIKHKNNIYTNTNNKEEHMNKDIKNIEIEPFLPNNNNNIRNSQLDVLANNNDSYEESKRLNMKSKMVSQLSQHIFIQYNPITEELFKKYDIEDYEVISNDEKSDNIQEILELQDNCIDENILLTEAYNNNYYNNKCNTNNNNKAKYDDNNKKTIFNLMEDILDKESNNQSNPQIFSKMITKYPSEHTLLKSTDRIKLLSFVLDELINFTDLTETQIYKEVKLKRYQNRFNKKNFINLNFDFFSNEKNKCCTENFRNTYGETTAFYVAWSFHFMQWCLFLSLITIVYKVSEIFISESYKLFFGLNLKFFLEIIYILFFLLIWLNFYTFSWTTREKVLTNSWGRQKAVKNKIRDEYEPFLKFKLLMTKIFIDDRASQIKNYTMSVVITGLMIIITIYSLTYIQLLYEPVIREPSGSSRIVNSKLGYYRVNQANNSTSNKIHDDSTLVNIVNGKELVYPPLPIYIPILTGVFILFLSKIYSYLGKRLTDNENHRLLESYNTSYILKQISFNIICQYYTIYYIIFVKSFNNTCYNNDCSTDLTSYLRSIFFSNYITTLLEIGLPFIGNKYFRMKANKSLNKLLSINKAPYNNSNDNENNIIINKYIYDNQPKKLSSKHSLIINNLINKEYSYLYKDTYDNIMGEYEQIIYLFGFVSQFIIIDHLLILSFVIFLYIQRIVDCKKLVDLYNTCLFENSEGIGIYNSIFKLIAVLSVFINMYVLFFIKAKKFMTDESSTLTNSEDTKKEDELFSFRNYILIQNIFVLVIVFVKFEFTPRWVFYNKSLTNDYQKKADQYAMVKIRSNSVIDT